MTRPLWTPDEIRAALPGAAVPADLGPVGGISIDTRTLQPGDLFFAIRGVSTDGHDHVPAALARGAAAAVVSPEWASRRPAGEGGVLIAVDGDVLDALRALAAAARARSRARIVAVTGSVGKTGTKEALRLVLSRFGRTHAADASYNNHWGVPLTLARLPADAQYAVFEIGMNHPGEIVPLTALVRPEVAVVTTVEPVHIAHFRSLSGIADAKGEIFSGLEPGGVAVVPADNGLVGRLLAHAGASRAGRIVSFGEGAGADVRAVRIAAGPDASAVDADVLRHRVAYRIGMAGRHVALNSLAVLAVASALRLDLDRVAAAYAELAPPAGRGDRAELALPGGGTVTLVDESFNANPASMRAALDTLALASVPAGGRRVAVLAEMGELGGNGPDAHLGLAAPIAASGAELVFLAGPLMRPLSEQLPAGLLAGYAETAPSLEAAVAAALRPGDVVVVKGSKSTLVSKVAAGLRSRFAPPPAAGREKAAASAGH